MGMTDADRAAMRERFGEEGCRSYIRLARAIRGLSIVWDQYQKAPGGSPIETAIKDQFGAMIRSAVAQPEKAQSLIEGLVGIWYQTSNRSLVKDYFEDVERLAEDLGMEP